MKFPNPLIFLIVLLSFLTIHCDNQAQDPNQEFAGFKDRFIQEFFDIYPEWGIFLGYYENASDLRVINSESIKREIDFFNNYLDSLKKFDPKNLSDLNKIDHKILEHNLKLLRWYAEEFKEYKWQPNYYRTGGGFGKLISSDYAPLEERLQDIGKRLAKVPEFYQSGRKNLENPTEVHTLMAISQNNGTIPLLDQTLRDSLKISNLSADKKEEISRVIDEAMDAVNNYVNWLENDLLSEARLRGRSFRIGEELYHKKFYYDLNSIYSAEEIYKQAVDHKEWLHDKMEEKTVELWSEYFGESIDAAGFERISRLLDTLSHFHTHQDSFVETVKKQIPELEEFIRENQIIHLPPDKPLEVRATPEYMRGPAGASVSSPGPFEKDGKTYYNVTPLNTYSDEEAKSFLREYNYYILQILNIHEAIPGHYTQMIYSNESPSKIKAIFGNGAMVEGWAVYTELMMLEEGYGNHSPELWLMYYKWILRSTINTILDYSVHVKNMNQKQALDLLMVEGFQEKAEAEQKFIRVKLSQVQLTSYFTGFREIVSLRKDLKERLGGDFNLKEFHEKFLSYGSAPVKYIREMMYKDYGLTPEEENQ